MTPNEYVIKKFELHEKELTKVVESWIENSLLRNWNDIKILIGRGILSNIPPSEWDDTIKMNKEYAYIKEKAEKVQQYLIAKGYKWVSISHPSTLQGMDGKFYSGTAVIAHLIQPDWVK